MNNEEKNLTPENESVDNNSPVNVVNKSKLSGGLIGGIIGGAVALILAIVLLVVLLPGNKDNGDGGNGDGNTETKVTYVVTVVDQNGNPIKSAKVTFAPKGATEIPFTTDADGKASYKTDKEVTVKVTSIPSGYEYDKLNAVQSFDKDGKLTVTLTKLAPFVIKVVDNEGNVVSGVTVQMCDEAGSCRLPRTTDANGEASYPYEEGNFKATLTVVPDGYTVEDPSAYYPFENGVATITLTKAN